MAGPGIQSTNRLRAEWRGVSTMLAVRFAGDEYGAGYFYAPAEIEAHVTVKA